MSYISTDNITSINAELTNYCNAACPMCARYFIDGELVKDKVNNMHTSLAFIKEKIGTDVIKRLRSFTSCGNYGDGAMNPECLDIYKWIKDVNPTCSLSLHSNGGARNEVFWNDLAGLGVHVTFAIDGLENTNHLYRRNVKWKKLMNNVKSFIEAGGTARWDMLVFKHNQDQVDECRQLSKALGFKNFTFKNSARWSDFDSAGNWFEKDKIEVDGHKIEPPDNVEVEDIGRGGNSQKINITKEEVNTKEIKCYAYNLEKKFVEIYLAVNGDVSPCCWLGDLKTHESKNIIKNYNKVNLNYSSLDEILEGDYFRQLEYGIKGKEGSYRLHTCYMTCGLKD
jgi:MoaA/NifB/PqqE/SkfB family radical SAM enzyme